MLINLTFSSSEDSKQSFKMGSETSSLSFPLLLAVAVIHPSLGYPEEGLFSEVLSLKTILLAGGVLAFEWAAVLAEGCEGA